MFAEIVRPAEEINYFRLRLVSNTFILYVPQIDLAEELCCRAAAL
jgi:hypothetical protein